MVHNQSPFQFQITASVRERPLRATWAFAIVAHVASATVRVTCPWKGSFSSYLNQWEVFWVAVFLNTRSYFRIKQGFSVLSKIDSARAHSWNSERRSRSIFQRSYALAQ